MSAPVDDPVAHEHVKLQREARKNRKAFAVSQLGAFARAMLEAMGEYFAARKSGMPKDDACKGLEAVLRAHWPKPTTKYPPLCGDCEGTGWRERTCDANLRCGRRICAVRHPSWEHPYVVPCDCTDGDRHRQRVQQPEDAIAAVGRVQKPKRGFSRMGQ